MKTKNYAWIIVGVGVLVKMTALGFGRFAYSMLLPNMREGLEFNYIQMGLLSGGILLGYLLFSLIGGMLATRFGSKRIVVASLLCSSISLFSMSRFSDFFSLLTATFGMGAGAGGAHISMTTLPMFWFGKGRLGRAVGIVAGGTGLGIIATGYLLPFLLVSLGKEAWRGCWLVMALITFSVAVAGLILLKDRPAGFHSEPESPEEKKAAPSPLQGDELTLRMIFLVYFVIGFSYIIYATYFVAYMVEDLKLSEKTAGDIWAIFGWMCMASGVLWGFLSDRLGRRKSLLWNNGIIALAVFIPLYFHQTFFLTLSAILFGGTFLGIVAVVAASIGDQVAEKKATVYGFLTLIHGIGQFLGTTIGGYLRDLTGSFLLTFISSLVGFLLCFYLTTSGKKSHRSEGI